MGTITVCGVKMAFIKVKRYKGKKYFQLYESVREGKKVRQKFLKYYGAKLPKGLQPGLENIRQKRIDKSGVPMTSVVYDRCMFAIVRLLEHCSNEDDLWNCDKCVYQSECLKLYDKFSDKLDENSMGGRKLTFEEVRQFISDFRKLVVG